MQDRVLIGVALVGAAIAAWLLLAPDGCSAPPPPPDAAIVDAAPPVDAAVVDALPPDAFSLDDESLTVETLQRYGMLDRPAKHLEALFADREYWTRDPRAPATWVNENETRLSFRIRGGRVVAIGAEFPVRTASAEVTSLSEWILGQHDALPFRLEIFDADQQILTRGSFEDRYGRRLYYRAKMRREGELPWGPSEFEIASTPWPGQSAELTPREELPGSEIIDLDAPEPPPRYHDPALLIGADEQAAPPDPQP